MTCETHRDQLTAYVLDELEPAELKEFSGHLEQCEACRLQAGRERDAEKQIARAFALAGPAARQKTTARRNLYRPLAIAAVAAALFAVWLAYPAGPIEELDRRIGEDPQNGKLFCQRAELLIDRAVRIESGADEEEWAQTMIEAVADFHFASQKGERELALRTAAKILADPGLPRDTARAAVRRGMIQLAVAEIRQGVGSDPGEAARLGIEELGRAVSLDPKYPRARLVRAHLHGLLAAHHPAGPARAKAVKLARADLAHLRQAGAHMGQVAALEERLLALGD